MPHYNSTFNSTASVAIGSDHAGFAYKTFVIELLRKLNLQFIDKGTYSAASVDYSDFAHPVAQLVESGKAGWGILICGSANGVAITANKHQNIRAAICWKAEIARLARLHNNANIICIPARFVSLAEAEEMIIEFFHTSFEAGRHEQRVTKIACS